MIELTTERGFAIVAGGANKVQVAGKSTWLYCTTSLFATSGVWGVSRNA
jgi:hypothetical protein